MLRYRLEPLYRYFDYVMQLKKKEEDWTETFECIIC